MRAPTQKDSTLGGAGFRPRQGTLRDDMGSVWTRCGVEREWDPLRAAVIVQPPDSLGEVTDPDAALMLERVDLERMRDACAALHVAYVDEGVHVRVLMPRPSAPPNLVFARDLFWMTPEGAVIARMAAEQRKGEEAVMADVLAGSGYPIRATIVGSAVMEGADLLWLGPGDVLAGVGRRTDRSAVAQLRALGYALEEVPVPSAVQHLLGAVNLLDRDLAVVHPSAEAPLLEALARRGIRAVELPDAKERDGMRANNFVTLRPREILLPAGCPRSVAFYQSLGVRCVEVDVTEYLRAAGGPGCLTGILHREA